MSLLNSDVPVLDTYQAVVAAYRDFLTVAIHTILFERDIYPADSFIKARKYNYPVRQSRHPKVCQWIRDAVAAVEQEMLRSSIKQTSLIIISPTTQPLERYVFNTAAFPRIKPFETLTPFAPPPPTDSTSNPTSNQPRYKPPPVNDLPEQFRATLARLIPSMARLAPLPEDSSYTLAIELHEDDAEPPLHKRENDPWIAGEVQPANDGEPRLSNSTQARTTPVRALEAGAFAMEVWIEEGQAKMMNPSMTQSSQSGSLAKRRRSQSQNQDGSGSGKGKGTGQKVTVEDVFDHDESASDGDIPME